MYNTSYNDINIVIKMFVIKRKF